MSYCAIFDFDETVIQYKSMLEVMKEYFKNNSSGKNPEEAYQEFLDDLRLFTQKNHSREESNKYYYSRLSGVSVKKICEASQNWFEANKNNVFREEIVSEINHHKKKNAHIIFVTGSFIDCIKPITSHLGVNNIICTNLQKCYGVFTGVINGDTIIGQGKANALLKYINEHNLSLNESYAYGDHESDIPFLTMATHPIVVGTNVVLSEYAHKMNWGAIKCC